MKKEIIIREIIKIIRKYLPESYKILLFGSWAKGDAIASSDIDIGILGENKVPREIMVKILEEAEKIATLRAIDIVDLNSADKIFKQNALKSAKMLNFKNLKRLKFRQL